MASRETNPDGGNAPDTSVRRAAAVPGLAQEPTTGLFPAGAAVAAAAAPAPAAAPETAASAATGAAAAGSTGATGSSSGSTGSGAAVGRPAAAPAAEEETTTAVPTVSGAASGSATPAAPETTATATPAASTAAPAAATGGAAAARTRTGAVSAVRARIATATRSAGPGSGAGAGAGADGTPPGRPNKPLIAAAALGGLVLIAVPFLISGSDEEKRKPVVAEGPAGSLMDPDSDDPGLVPGEEKIQAPGAAKGVAGSKGVTPATGTTGARAGGPGPLTPVPGPQEAGAPLPGVAGGTGTGGAAGPGAGTGTGGQKAPGTPAGAGNPKSPAGPAKQPPAAPGTKTPPVKTPTKSTPAAKPPPPPAPATYSHLVGPGCDTPGFAATGRYDKKGKDRWRGGRGSTTGYGCNGFYFSVPNSDRSTDDSTAQWKFSTGKVTKGVCSVQVYIPNVKDITRVGGNPAYYTVYRAFTPKSGNVLGTFSIRQTSHLGNWVNAGSYAISGGKLSVVLGNRGSDTGGRHAAAAPVRINCTAS
ncbi:hypothetical protein ACWDR0_32880 [Streptomyces sp. NPDC003691]